MRKFYFENEAGERIRLNNEDGIFLYAPGGLGVEFSHEYGKSGGDGFFRRNKFSTTQLGPEFTLLFDPNKVDPYAKFQELLGWFASSAELYFVYSPSGEENKEYYRRINIQRIEKSEIDTYGSLRTPMTVLLLTPWFLPIPFSATFGSTSAYAKRYDYKYDNTLRYGYNSVYPYCRFTAEGHIPAAVKVEIHGAITNPEIMLFGVNTGTIYGDCAISTTLTSNDTLVLSTIEQDSYVKKIVGGKQEIDLIDSIDILKNAFFKVPLTEPCELQIRGTGYSGNATMYLYQFYRGV